MGLMEQLKDLPKTDKISMDDLKDNPLMKAAEEPTIEDIKKDPEPKEEIKEEKDAEEPEEPEEGDAIEAKDEKPEVKGYKGRKINEYKTLAEERTAELQRANERADRLERELLQRREPKTEEKTPVNAQPDPETDPDGFVRWALLNGVEQTKELKNKLADMEVERAYDKAGAALAQMEKTFSREVPHYEDALEYATSQEVARQKLFNPNASEAAIRKKMEKDRILAAARFEAQGKDPVKSLYELMMTSGYSPKEDVSESQENSKDEAKNFDAIRKNKAKSATSLAAGGKTGSVEAGPESARKLTVAEFSKLSKDQKDRIYRDKR